MRLDERGWNLLGDVFEEDKEGAELSGPAGSMEALEDH
jgi:hypothetical protein